MLGSKCPNGLRIRLGNFAAPGDTLPEFAGGSPLVRPILDANAIPLTLPVNRNQQRKAMVSLRNQQVSYECVLALSFNDLPYSAPALAIFLHF